MSYCVLYGLSQATQELEEINTYRNASGFCSRIWSGIADNIILPVYPHKYGSCTTLWSEEELERLWRLARDPNVHEFARATLAATFDYATVSADNRLRLSEHLREFAETLKPDLRGYVSHIEEMSRNLAGAIGDYKLFCWYGHSVGENLWDDWDEEKDEPKPYDFSTRTDHFEIYEYISGGS